jgi:hypothetical protein
MYHVDTVASQDRGAKYNVGKVMGWIREGLREAFFNLPPGARLELKPVIQKTMPEYAGGL